MLWHSRCRGGLHGRKLQVSHQRRVRLLTLVVEPFEWLVLIEFGSQVERQGDWRITISGGGHRGKTVDGNGRSPQFFVRAAVKDAL